MRNSFAALNTSPLKPPSEVVQLARFHGLACRPNLDGPRIVNLGATRVFIQPMDFVGLADARTRPAPPVLIGPVQDTPNGARLVAKVAPRLLAVTALDACVDDEDGTLKGIVTAMVFEVDVFAETDNDFRCWRRCRGDLEAWHGLAFPGASQSEDWPTSESSQRKIDVEARPASPGPNSSRGLEITIPAHEARAATCEFYTYDGERP